jgi:two-component system LytT family response regulator
MRAILVDDEPDGIRTLKKLLELNCPEVEIVATCSSAADAISKLEEAKPDLIFLDVRMPGGSGIDMLAELSEIDFEVIFVTAHDEYMLQALQFSAVDYLMKPVDEDRLKEAVQRVEERLKGKRNSRQGETLLHNINKVGYPLEMRLFIVKHKEATQYFAW